MLSLFQEYMNSILQHCRDFKEFHRNNQAKVSRLSKALLSHHATLERELRKKQELLEKERIRRLMVRMGSNWDALDLQYEFDIHGPLYTLMVQIC